MNKHLTSAAQACARTIPHVYTTKTVKKHLTRTPVRYHARPLYSGPSISVTITLTDVVIDPPLDGVCGNRLVGFNRNALTGWRRYLGHEGCDAVRLDGRVLNVDGSRECKIDFFRVCLLQGDMPRVEKVILPEYPQGDPALISRYLEVGRSNATDALARASDLSVFFTASTSKPYTDVSADMDAVLWVSEVTRKGPSFVVPLKNARRSSQEPAKAVCASAPVKMNDAGNLTPSTPKASTLPPDPRRLLALEEIIPWLDREIAYVAHPLFDGQDVTIVVDESGFRIEEKLVSAEELDRLSKICNESQDRLREFFEQVIKTVGGDTVRLDGRIVAEQRGMPWCLDIHRTVVLDKGNQIIECPYDEKIFPLDEQPHLRLFTWLSQDTADAMKNTLQDLTFSIVDIIARGQRPVKISGTLWLPVNNDRYRPSFFVPFKPSPMSTAMVEAFLANLFSKQIDHLYHLEGVEITPWK